MNRSKRRKAKLSAAQHDFGWETMTGAVFQRFKVLHNFTLQKFKWKAPKRWQRQLEKICAGWKTKHLPTVRGASKGL